MISASALTLGEYVRGGYLLSRGLESRPAPETLTAARQWEQHAAGVLLVSQMSQQGLALFLRHRMSLDAPTTVNVKRARLLAVWRQAYRDGEIRRRPPEAGTIPRARVCRNQPKARTLAELAALVQRCRRLDGAIGSIAAATWWTALVLVAWVTGERIGALLAVTWKDVDLTSGWMTVAGDKRKNRCGLVYRLSPEAIDALRSLPCGARESTVWPWPFKRRWFFVHARRLMESAGWECSTSGRDLWHSVRRSTISYAAATDMEMARRQAGHADVRTTIRNYIDPRIAGMRQAADVLPVLSSIRPPMVDDWSI